MASVNKVFLIGNVGKDPEIKMIGENKIAQFSIAMTERYRGKDGQMQEQTEWMTVVAFRFNADLAEKYIRKGMVIHVEGKLRTRSWESQGVKQYRTEVVADSIVFLSRTPDEQEKQQRKPLYEQAQEMGADGDLAF